MKKHKKKISLFLALLFIEVIYLYRFRELSTFYVLNDELGYWANGALIAGYDWSGIMRGVSYYSFGYGVLLAPIIKLINSPQMMYQAAIFLNALMGGLMLIFIFYSFDKLYPHVSYLKKIFVALAICLCSDYIVNAHIAWSETLLNLLVWTLLFLLIMYHKTDKIHYLFFSMINCIFMLMVHTRMVSIAASFFILILILWSKKVLNTKNFLVIISTFFIGTALWLCLRIYFKSMIWGNCGDSTNDFSSEIAKVFTLFTPRGLINFFIISIGQLFYCAVSSYLLSYNFLVATIKKVIKAVRDQSLFFDTTNIISGFLLISSLFTLFMASLALINVNRIDHFIYGRYIGATIFPIIGIGTMNALDSKEKIHLCKGGAICFFIISGLFIKKQIEVIETQSYFAPCASALYWFVDSDGINMYALLLFTILVASIFYCVKYIFKRLSIYVITCFIAIYGVLVSFNYINNEIIPTNQFYSKISKLVERNENDLNAPIYVLLNDNDGKEITSRARFQFALKDKKIIAQTQEELSTIEGPFYLLGENTSPFIQDLNVALKDSFGNYFIWEKKNNFNNCINISLDSFYSQNRDNRYSERFISNGDSGYLLYGPYYSLNPSQYSVIINLELIQDRKDNNNGYLEVVSGADVYGRSPIQHSGSIMLDFFVSEVANNIEIRLHTEEQVIIEVSSVELYIKNEPINLLKSLTINPQIMRDSTNQFKTNGLGGTVFWGPYIRMPKGDYIVSITGEIANPNVTNTAGAFRIYNKHGTNLLAPVYNLNDFIKNGRLDLAIPLRLSETTENVEFVLTESEGTIITIETCTLEY